MKGSLIVFVVIYFIVLSELPKTQALYKNICRLFPDGTKLGDPRACNSYITCTNSSEVTTKCPNNQIFSVDSKKCITSKTNCTDPCLPDDDDYYLADPKSCSGYYYCSKGVGLLGNCAKDQHFNEKEQMCIYAENSKCKGDNYCEVVPNNINFKDEDNCEKYKVCVRGKLKSKTCPKGQWFDRQSGECRLKADVSECDFVQPNICKNGIKVERNKFVKDKKTCRGYYYCADVGKSPDENPEWHQCKEGLFFSYKTQSCMDPVSVECDEDRCDGRGDLFVNSASDCQHYLVCQNGRTIAERKCADEMFFDEKRQGCTAEIIEHDVCS